MDQIKVENVPSTIICARAVNDISDFLEKLQAEQGLSSDLMCMILRDILSKFERKRADDYSATIVRDLAVIQMFKAENEKLKQMTELFDVPKPEQSENNQTDEI
jgi:hypothetical protein